MTDLQDKVSALLRRKIYNDYLNAMDGHPDIVGHWQAAEAVISLISEEAALIVERWSLPTIQTPSMWLVDKAGIAADIRELSAVSLQERKP